MPNLAGAQLLGYSASWESALAAAAGAALVVVLASVAMVPYQNSVTRAREAVLKEDLYRLLINICPR